MQYKTVAVPLDYSIRAGDPTSCEKLSAKYAEIIKREAVDGWVLDMIQAIPVKEKPGCLAGLFGAKAIDTTFNMLVFKKED